MITRINEESWLLDEMEGLPVGGQPDMAAGGPPMSQPGGPGDPMGAATPGAQQTDPPQQEPPAEDLSQDPQYPEMPEDEQGNDDFESWRIEYVKESIKGDPAALEAMIAQIMDKELDPNPDKFVRDNLQICFLRQHQDYLIPSKKIRKMVKEELDRNSPATTVVKHITTVLDEHPLLGKVYIKLMGAGGGKQDWHRKHVAALLGAVQVGSGAAQEDLVFEETDYSIRISTRFNSKWGDVNLGRWNLTEQDPERYLKGPELQRLEGGSPEEKDVLRRRVVMESIAEKFKERAFIINVVSRDGTIQHLGLDLGNCLKSAFIDGKLVVRTKSSDNLEAFIDESGAIVPIPNMSIYFVKEKQDSDEIEQDMEELQFIEYRAGELYLTAQGDLVKEAAMSLSGIVFKELPFQGNPTDLLRISRCSPTLPEILLKDC